MKRYSMRVIIQYFLLVTFAVGCAHERYIQYQETKNDLQPGNFSKIIIIGTGTSGTNLFLETLSNELNKRLRVKGVETVYHHLGNNQTEASRVFKEIVSKEKYDAVLQFAQLDGAHNPIIAYSDNGSWPIQYQYNHRAIRFHQIYSMKYFDFRDLNHTIIEVNLDLNIDFINPNDYSKLSKLIIRSLKIG